MVGEFQYLSDLRGPIAHPHNKFELNGSICNIFIAI